MVYVKVPSYFSMGMGRDHNFSQLIESQLAYMHRSMYVRTSHLMYSPGKFCTVLEYFSMNLFETQFAKNVVALPLELDTLHEQDPSLSVHSF